MHSFYRAQALTLIYSWAFALIYIVLGGSFYASFFIGFYVIYFWIPGFIALQFYHHEKMTLPLNVKWKTDYLWPILIAISLFLFNIILILPFSSIRSLDTLRSYYYSFLGHLTPFSVIFICAVTIILLAIILGSTVYLAAYLGPEIMWRGYAWDKLKTLGFWKASLISGLLMGVWKAPLILMGLNYPLHPYMGLLWQVIFSISIAPLALYYRIKTRSVLGPAFFVSVYFAYTDFIPILFKDSQSLWTGSMGFINIIALNVFNALLCLKMSKNPLLEYEV